MEAKVRKQKVTLCNEFGRGFVGTMKLEGRLGSTTAGCVRETANEVMYFVRCYWCALGYEGAMKAQVEELEVFQEVWSSSQR